MVLVISMAGSLSLRLARVGGYGGILRMTMVMVNLFTLFMLLMRLALGSVLSSRCKVCRCRYLLLDDCVEARDDAFYLALVAHC